jgi:hypothetical protein
MTTSARMAITQPFILIINICIIRFAGAIILELTYGYKVKGDQDELVSLVQQVMHDTDQTGRQGGYLADLIPQSTFYVGGNSILTCLQQVSVDLLPSWLPGTGYRQEAAEYRRRFTDFRNIPFEYTRNNMVSESRPDFFEPYLTLLQEFDETSRSSFVGKRLQVNLTPELEDEDKHTAALMYAGGADTVGAHDDSCRNSVLS